MANYTYADLVSMDDEILIEIASDQLGLGALGEDIPETLETAEERESLIDTILAAQADTQERS